MRFLALSALALPVIAGLVLGLPSEAPDPNKRVGLYLLSPTFHGHHPSSDVQILNFVLSIELLLAALFEQGLRKSTPGDFVNTGLPQFTLGRLEQIRKHTEIHTAFLKQAITDSGSPVVQPCNYIMYVLSICAYMQPYRSRRPLEDPRSLIEAVINIATVLASAFYGAIGRMENADYRTALASISGTISRQAGWLNSAVLEKSAWNTAFDAPLTSRQAWTIVQRYISSCPPENAELFSTGFPDTFTPLDISGALIPGSRGIVKFDKMVELLADRLLEVVFTTGIGELRSPLENGGFFNVPRGVAGLGTAYVFVALSDGPITDLNIIAGPALVQFPSSSRDISF